jgi:hypothetical protein
VRILLSSPFKPFGIDGKYGRKEALAEIFHNQLTLTQGAFSIRNFTTSNALHVIANNIDTPTTVLDCPTLNHYIKEIRNDYDIIGISAQLPNFNQLKKMLGVTRQYAPKSRIVVGGFVAAIPDIKDQIDADDICKGEGIGFMRNLLGLPPEYSYQNPRSIFSETKEIFGVPVIGLKRPLMVVGLGCTYGCDFCSTSHFFGKKHIKLIRSGKELFNEIIFLNRKYPDATIGCVGDDNFLVDLERAEELRTCLIQSGQAVKLYIFASADRIVEFGIEKLAETGVDIVWIGRESKYAGYRKNQSVDCKALIAEMKKYGIKPIMSSMLLVDAHSKENIYDDIDDHIAGKPVFSQFLFYTPTPGTPLYQRFLLEGRINTELTYEDYNGRNASLVIHPAFSSREARQIQDDAYYRDFEQLGPSLVRYIETDFTGWLHLKDSGKSILRARAETYARKMGRYRTLLYAIALLSSSQQHKEMCNAVRRRIESSFGKITINEKAIARGLFFAGSIREARTRRWGDSMQPSSYKFYFNQGRSDNVIMKRLLF